MECIVFYGADHNSAGLFEMMLNNFRCCIDHFLAWKARVVMHFRQMVQLLLTWNTIADLGEARLF